MPNQVFISDADVFQRIGGKAALTQLLDPNRTGTWDQATLDSAKQDACNFVLEAAGVAADLGGYQASEFASKFPNLVTYAALKALALVWTYGTGGQAMPDRIAAFDAQAMAGLELLATRRRKHGASDYSPQPSQQINGTISMGEGRMTLAGWKSGFC